MRRLYSYMARYRGRYAVGAVCLLATATFAMAIPYLLKRAVEVIEHGHPPEELRTWILMIIGLAVVQAIARTLSRALIFNVGRDIEYDLRNDLFVHMEGLSLDYYQTHSTGDLMSRLVNDLGAVRMMLGPGFLNLVNTPIYYVYGMAIMLTISVPLTFLSLAVYPVVFLLVIRFSRRVMERTLKVQEGLAGLSTRAQENLSGMGVVKAYALEDAETRRFRRLNDDFRERGLELARVRGLVVPLMKVVSNSGILVVLWFGGWQVVRGTLGFGDLVAFIAYLHLLAWPTMAMGWMLSIVQRGRAAMQRLEEIFLAEPSIVGPGRSDVEPIERGEIEFENVSFAYPGRRGAPDAIVDASFRVPAGATVAIVGRTGAGKSTLLNFVPRLFDPSGGKIRIDGRDVRSMPLSVLRRSIGMVQQDPFLFSRTMGENIGFALGGNGDDGVRIAAAAEQAGLGPDLQALPRGLDTTVGERGVTLSGGQKQRVTLARALAADPKILILDDALSSVDGETERRIVDNVRRAFPDRTWLLTSHRLTTVKDADRIVVIDDGRVVATGTHQELLLQGGVYRELFRQQALESELERL